MENVANITPEMVAKVWIAVGRARLRGDQETATLLQVVAMWAQAQLEASVPLSQQEVA